MIVFKKSFIVAFCFFGILMSSTVYSETNSANNPQQEFTFRFSPGETIVYNVKKFGIKVGQSRLIYEGVKSFRGKDYMLIVFRTKIVKFEGEERIYLDLKTLYPAFVERDIKIFGKKEYILEEYLQDTGEVKITKKTDKEASEQIIKKDGAIDNVQAFIFRYRKEGSYKIGEKLEMNLPLSDVALVLTDKDQIELVDKMYDTYFMKGQPRNLKIWFDKSAHHVPLRIDGKFGMGNVSLIFNDYLHF